MTGVVIRGVTSQRMISPKKRQEALLEQTAAPVNPKRGGQEEVRERSQRKVEDGRGGAV